MAGVWDVAAQLQKEFQGSICRAIETRRTVITHLNADTSWLIQIPRPQSDRKPNRKSRYYFNVVIDPWLSGPQSDVASWLSIQWHSVDSSVETIRELEERLRDIERLAQATDKDKLNEEDEDLVPTYIDLVVISHEFTDHCHEATLREMSPSVPVVTTEKAASLIKSWGHFDTVSCTPSFHPGTDWRQTTVRGLPQWLGLSRIISPGNMLYYHSAILICIGGNLADEAAEAIIYTPHGVNAKDLGHVVNATPPVQTLAFMHGLHDVSMTMKFQLNLGAHNALKAQRVLKASYWVGTHDEVKKGGGIVAALLRRTVLTLQEAVEKEAAENGETASLDGVNFAELRSGESLLLL